jgi:ABC-type sugar transport system substrate-binding protein
MLIQKVRTFLALLTVTALSACASGSSIVTGATRTPIDPSEVRLYLDAPDRYETIGLVNASSDAGWTEQGSQDYAIEELKKQAAKLGANGVLLMTSGEKTSSFAGASSSGAFYAIPDSEHTVSGKAIYVSP